MHDHNAPEPTHATVMPTQATSTTQSFFHVDRRGTLAHTGGYIALSGAGLSEHGRQYQLDEPVVGSVSWNGSSANIVSTNLAVENFWELYRRATFPALPSRFHSLFAFTSINDARRFAKDAGGAPILELCVPAGAVIHRGDMDWLKAGNFAFMLDCADRYWTGQPMTATPVWEALIALPVVMTLTPLP
ncbi:hypothetical protein CH299_11870 [Rhodococcus sp. 14-2686-1-2]|nr:hypothetical protein CH301_11320 [Rhodococcus sp. 15-1189-1-1a]OZF15492.1 hypothetical protein CH299_11870 [Rhodococcus sp. 14-2686-1-2]